MKHFFLLMFWGCLWYCLPAHAMSKKVRNEFLVICMSNDQIRFRFRTEKIVVEFCTCLLEGSSKNREIDEVQSSAEFEEIALGPLKPFFDKTIIQCGEPLNQKVWESLLYKPFTH